MIDRELLEAVIEAELNEIRDASAGLPPAAGELNPSPAADVHEFYELVGNVIKAQQESEGTPAIKYGPSMPEVDDNLQSEIITYSLQRRRPATMQGVQVGLASNERRVRNRRYLPVGVYEDPDHPGMKIWREVKFFENWVLFTVWARTSKQADQRVMWFEELMDNWMPYFRAKGIEKIDFESRESDFELAPENRKVVGRPVIFYVKTAKVRAVREANLRRIELQGSV